VLGSIWNSVYTSIYLSCR